MLSEPRACGCNCGWITVDRRDGGPGRKKGGAMSAAPQSAIEYVVRPAEQLRYFIR